jgi:Zn-dependent peptidase ImmA (M78 family)
LIAHGLAHYLFHRNVRVNYFLDERDNRFNYWKQRRQERGTEIFAAYLLIPEDKLNERLKEEMG